MKKILTSLAIFFLTANIFAAPMKKDSKVYVSVKSSSLKSDSAAVSKTVKTLSYGDCLIVSEPGEKKTKVTLAEDSSVEGWVLNSEVTTKKIITNSKGSSDTSSDELALAGKGFSEEAEKAFRTTKTNLDYNKIDAIEKITVSQKDFQAFVEEGHLKGGAE